VVTDPHLIRVADLTKDYVLGDNTVHALAGVSIDIAAGEFVAVMGPSGSGKSTFMNMIGCLDRPTSGSYFLAGEDVARMNADDLAAVRNRRIGFVFQQFNLLARTSALENVELPLLYANVAVVDRRARNRHPLLQGLNAGGMTIVLVTHEQDVAAFASREVHFRDGKVVSDKRQTPRLARSALSELDANLDVTLDANLVAKLDAGVAA